MKQEETWHVISDVERQQIMSKIREQFKEMFSKKKREQMTIKKLQEDMKKLIYMNFKQYGERIRKEQDEKKKFQILDEYLLMKKAEEQY